MSIAIALNDCGFRTRRGKKFWSVQMQRVVALFLNNLPLDRWRLV